MDQLSKMVVFVFIPSKKSLFLTQISFNITTCSLATEAFIESLLSVLFNKISILLK